MRTAHWVKRNGRISGLVTFDTYGRQKELGLADVLGKYNAQQIATLRATLPTVEV